ncbi:MAG TPA: hypothetical protein VNG29_03600 [Candidatus Paceibacterota bacterium]|nr:hypothetical protein [Candidatus Paceibacterota bacterium]
MAPFEFSWQAPEYEYREKGAAWYWISIVVAALVIGAAVWERNFLFGFFIVIAESLLLVYANRKPETMEFALNEHGLTIHGYKSYAYTDMESWSVDEFGDTEWPSLFFQFRRRLKPPIKLKIPKAKIPDVQKVMKPILPQVPHEHSMLDTLEELIRF